MLTPDTVLTSLRALAESRPGFEPANYATARDYRSDVRAATNALHDVRELLRYVGASSYGAAVTARLVAELQSQRGRVSADDQGRVWYTAGQYYCVEYRPAIARMLADAIWQVWREEMIATGPVTGDIMRKRARLRFSRRIARRYFDA